MMNDLEDLSRTPRPKMRWKFISLCMKIVEGQLMTLLMLLVCSMCLCKQSKCLNRRFIISLTSLSPVCWSVNRKSIASKSVKISVSIPMMTRPSYQESSWWKKPFILTAQECTVVLRLSQEHMSPFFVDVLGMVRREFASKCARRSNKSSTATFEALEGWHSSRATRSVECKVLDSSHHEFLARKQYGITSALTLIVRFKHLRTSISFPKRKAWVKGHGLTPISRSRVYSRKFSNHLGEMKTSWPDSKSNR